MPMVTPTLNLAPPPVSTKAAAATPPAAAATAPPTTAPSTTVTISPQAISAMAAASHPNPSPASTNPSTSSATPAPEPHDGSVYDALKHGIASAIGDVGEAIEGGAHAIVEGVETTVSTANKMVQGVLELPFAAVAKVCDAAGAIIDNTV